MTVSVWHHPLVRALMGWKAAAVTQGLDVAAYHFITSHTEEKKALVYQHIHEIRGRYLACTPHYYKREGRIDRDTKP
jgi:hypothetical protein